MHSWRMLGPRPMCVRCLRVEISATMALAQWHLPCGRACCKSSVVAMLAAPARGHDAAVQAMSDGFALVYCRRCAAYAQRALGALG